jgi:membrane-bound lytic murein transglycosylase D
MKFRLIVAFIFILTWTGVLSLALGEDLNPVDLGAFLKGLNAMDRLEFCGERVPLEAQEIRERLEKEFLLIVWNRPQVYLWLKRSRRYLPTIETILKENGMPDDLKYVAVAESSLLPHAGSHKGAIGFWQFLKSTGIKYGLTINSRKDERRNLLASTRAAVRYLRELHALFGSWTLAAAAYNMGEDGLMAEVQEQGTSDYYRLYLPLETQRYLFQILTTKLIFSDPARYGFHLADEEHYPPIESESLRLACPEDVPIRVVAQAARTDFKTIKDLNPEIRGHYLSRGSHEIMVPRGGSEGFGTRYEELLKKYLVAQSERIYIVKSGDSLSSIADRFGVPLTSLLVWNRLDVTQPIQPGQKIIVFQRDMTSVGNDLDQDER